MTNYIQYNPNGIFENAKDGVCPVINVLKGLLAATDNQLAVSAVTGKIILVLEASLCSATTAAGIVYFRDGSAGTAKRAMNAPPNNVGPGNFHLPFNPAGYFQSTAGTGLYINNTSAAAAELSISYITYTP